VCVFNLYLKLYFVNTNHCFVHNLEVYPSLRRNFELRNLVLVNLSRYVVVINNIKFKCQLQGFILRLSSELIHFSL